MDASLNRLLPPPCTALPLQGRYLEHDLAGRPIGAAPFVFTNFIATLDGRISLPDPRTGEHRVPPCIANPHDLRLYMELLAQADVLLTTARHLRALARGMQPNMMMLDAGRDPDLVEMRERHGLAAQPALCVLSASLDLPARAELGIHPGPLLVATPRAAPAKRMEALRAQGYELMVCGARAEVDAGQLVRALREKGYRAVYSIGGSRVLHTLLRADVVDRLYLTLAQILTGGEDFNSLSFGPELDPPRAFGLSELYHDPELPEGGGQLFAVLDRLPVSR